MEIIRQQEFNVDFFEFSHEDRIYRVGIGNYKNKDCGCEMFFPESGSDYILVIYNNGWYKFHMNEFTHDFGIEYISEKLKCSMQEAQVVHDFVASILNVEAAKCVLTNEKSFRNPMLFR